MKENILISTGGSGGHVVPAQTLYEHLKDEFNVFLTSDLRGYVEYHLLSHAILNGGD